MSGITDQLQQEFLSAAASMYRGRGSGGRGGFERGGFDRGRGGGFERGRGGFDRGGGGGFERGRGGGGFDRGSGGFRGRGGSANLDSEYLERYNRVMSLRGGVRISQFIPPQPDGQAAIVLDEQGQPIKSELQVSAGRTVKGQHVLLNQDCTFAFKVPICDFYMRQGSCRHQDKCTKIHVPTVVSPTVMLPMLYVNPKHIPHDDRGKIINYDEKWLAKHFHNFYERIWMSMMHFGRIRELQVCDNMCPHLLGHVYVCYEDEVSAANCVTQLKHKKFEGILILPELVPVNNFNEAACGDYDNGVCARGEACNFLHILRPPKALVLDLLEAQDIFWEEKAKECEEVALRKEEEAMLKALEAPLFSEDELREAAAKKEGRNGQQQQRHHHRHDNNNDNNAKNTVHDSERNKHHRHRQQGQEDDDSQQHQHKESRHHRRHNGENRDQTGDRHHRSSRRDEDRERGDRRREEDREREDRHRHDRTHISSSSRKDDDRGDRHDRHHRHSSRKDKKEEEIIGGGSRRENEDRERRRRREEEEDRRRGGGGHHKSHDDSRRRRRSESPRNNSGNPLPSATSICHICGQTGHFSRDCPLKLQL